jgi:hypothetical protein
MQWHGWSAARSSPLSAAAEIPAEAIDAAGEIPLACDGDLGMELEEADKLDQMQVRLARHDRHRDNDDGRYEDVVLGECKEDD